jgi:hypothetical protein
MKDELRSREGRRMKEELRSEITAGKAGKVEG